MHSMKTSWVAPHHIDTTKETQVSFYTYEFCKAWARSQTLRFYPFVNLKINTPLCIAGSKKYGKKKKEDWTKKSELPRS